MKNSPSFSNFFQNQTKYMNPYNFLSRSKRSLNLMAILIAIFFAATASAQEGWQLTGNRNANALSQVGTTNGIPLRFATKNTSWLLLDSLGNFGVSTQTPKYPLDVAGKMRLVDGSQGVGKVLTSDANGLATWLTPASNPWISSGNNLYNINTGNIGVGTATPKAKLDVNGDALINGVKVGRGNSVYNTFTGSLALDSNSTGVYNSALGYAALGMNKTGLNNTAIGANTLASNVAGFNNTATGAYAMNKTVGGKNNAVYGAYASFNNLGGSKNVVVGDSASYNNTSGSRNVAVGANTMLNNVNGSYNTAVGQQALLSNKSGTYNTAIGYNAGSIGGDSAILTYATAIGANAKTTQNNTLILGDTTSTRVGIGTTTPSVLAKLDIAGKIRIADGTQALNRVLTSDANGLAKWKVAPGALWNSVGDNAYYTLPGKVGIGTTTPTQKLEINNTMKFTNNSSDINDGVIGTAPFTAGLNIVGINTDNTSRKINFWGGLIQNENNEGNLLVGNTAFPYGNWDENGNVGIGKVENYQRLNINGNIQFNNADLPKSFIDEVGGTSPLFTMGVNFHEANKNDAYRGGAYRLDTRDGVPLNQWLSRLPNSSSEDLIMALRDNAGLSIGTTFSNYNAPDNGAIIQGNVGIGNTSPGYKLHVAGDIYADGGWLRASGNAGVYFESWGGGFYMNDNTWIRTNNEKNIWTGNGLLGSQGGLTIGYGGATPSFGGATIAGYTSLNGGALITGGYVTLCNSQDNSQGNVGIGSFGYSNVKLRVNTTEDFGIFVDGGDCAKPGGGSWSATSDKRLKKEVKVYSDGLEALLKIKPVTYHYNELSGFDMDKEYVGVIAQELQEVAPYMVTSTQFKNTGKEYLSVNNSAMTYMLINSVKELKGQVDTKDATITKQQEQLNALQTQMTALLKRVDGLQATQEACCNMPKQINTEVTTSLNSASLDQNIPNPPANHATKIGYNVPKGATKAEMIITDNFGKKLKTINLSVMGKGQMNIDTRGLAPGTYSYTLMVDGKMIDTKQMMVGTN